MLDKRLQAILRDVEQLTPRDQQQLADHLEEWLKDIEWRRVLNDASPDAVYEEAVAEIRQGVTKPLHDDDFADEA
ncbi:MAG TPA: hypothetical protein VJN88_13400 [Ktedonobacterales bacterium]|nr:hypothetical protein [Ktedonobacterales bacterium]